MKVLMILILISASFESLDAQDDIRWTQSECHEMMESCELLNGKPGSPGFRGPKGFTGPPGIPGSPGNQGPTGEPGEPPRGGGGFPIKGQKGDRGETGSKGAKGSFGVAGEGGLGPSGENGRPGIQGRKGDQGPIGPRGDSGEPGVNELNWKQCAFKPDINMQSGELHSCTFLKLHNDTSLHVMYQGDTHVGLCGSCCKTWLFTFDNMTCTDPGSIDAVYSGLQLVQRNETSTLPVLMHGSVSGYCSSVPGGLVRVGLSLADCPGYHSDQQFVPTIIQPNSRIMIQEVPAPQP